jgi:dolichol kinase
MGIGCFFLYALYLDQKLAALLVLGIGGPFVVFDIVRLKSARVKHFALAHFGPLMRRNELLGLSGNSFFILGLLTVTLFFPKPIALVSILFLAVGDPVAASIGTRYGKHRIWAGKSMEGAFANALASALVSGVFASVYLGKSPESALAFAALGAVVSVVAELVPLPVDDNFSVPVLSALQLSLIDRVISLF